MKIRMNIDAAICNHVMKLESRHDIAPPVNPANWEGPGWYVREDDYTDTHCRNEQHAMKVARDLIKDKAITREECV